MTDGAFRLLDRVIEKGVLVHIRVGVLNFLGKGYNFQTVVFEFASAARPLSGLRASLGQLLPTQLSVTIGVDSLDQD